MSKLVQYICDVCQQSSHTEAEMSSVTVAIANSVVARKSSHAHHEHVCPRCLDTIVRALKVTADGKPVNPRIVQLRHAG